jgi:CelD/BcsL family acetyltransferase involved in cellulose biosynthesis
MFKALTATEERVGAAPQAGSASSIFSTLSVVTTIQGLRDLEHKWRDLEANTPNNSCVFQSFDWVMAWTETYITPDGGDSLHIIAGYDNDDLVFLWPLMRSRSLGLAVLTWLTEPFGQYGDVMCRRGHSPKLWVESAVTFINRLKDVDILRLRHVRSDSQISSCAAQLFVDAHNPEGAPFLDLSLFPNDDAYEARYNSVQRRRRKKIRKGLEDMGTVAFSQLPIGTLSDAAIKQAIDEKNKWLAERGRINRILGCPSHLTFLKNLSRRRNGSVEVVVTELKSGENPVSWEISFRHKDTHFGYITSHVNSLTDRSPGRLHMDLSQRACLADGIKIFDLMVPNDTHKESWSSGEVAVADYYLPLSLSGRVVGWGYIRTLRPLLRAAYYKMNAATLRKFNIFNLFKTKPKPPSDS